MSSKKADSNDGCLGMGGLMLLFLVIGGVMMIPKGVWIGLGVLAGLAVVAWLGVIVFHEVDKRKQVRSVELEKQRKAAAIAEKQARTERLGSENARSVDLARSAVEQIVESRAAREGWLGDVDFAADIEGIESDFARAQELRMVANELKDLPEPSPEDRRLLADAVAATDRLENAGRARVALIADCAREAALVDESLSDEDQRARTEEQREELHRRLSTMLYGAEASATESPSESAADQVLARVAGYREIKRQIADTAGTE
ncbi:MAG: hypothetical protein WBA98_17750 [Gordonia sp. (in: high G+C Gram-positive bacteria)]|uniref:hypothetical protein n=1 Tax=Gordonia sp. (in: high G+C Gram-positive bacteria) TaxID=84139 RepID=UPI003C77DDE0